MISRIAKLLLTGTALAPVVFLSSLVAFSEGAYVPGIALIATSILLILVCLAILSIAQSSLEKSTFAITSAEIADAESLSIIVLYLLPLLRVKFSEINWLLIAVGSGFTGLIIMKGYVYHFNPVLNMFNWHFYKVGTAEGITYVLITKRQLRNTTGSLTVGQLTEYVIIDMEGL